MLQRVVIEATQAQYAAGAVVIPMDAIRRSALARALSEYAAVVAAVGLMAGREQLQIIHSHFAWTNEGGHATPTWPGC